MDEHQIHHVVVRDDDGIAGVVSSMDFVRMFARGSGAPPGDAPC